jgi:hypothetical protein
VANASTYNATETHIKILTTERGPNIKLAKFSSLLKKIELNCGKFILKIGSSLNVSKLKKTLRWQITLSIVE